VDTQAATHDALFRRMPAAEEALAEKEAALADAHSDLGDKAVLLQKLQQRLQHTLEEGEELVVRAARMRTKTIILRAAAREWRGEAVRPAHAIASRLSVLRDKRSTAKILKHWSFNVLQQRRSLRKIAALDDRWKAARLLTICLKWCLYTRVRYHSHLRIARAKQYVQFLRMQRGLRRLRMRVRNRQSLALQRQRVVAKTVRNVLAHIIRKWNEARTRRKTSALHNRRCRRRTTRSNLTQVIRQWRDNEAEEKQLKNKALKVVQRMLNGALVSTFERWRDSKLHHRGEADEEQGFEGGAENAEWSLGLDI
jgi:hypothetical protein